jgi:single-strand DNA-binding protein
VGMAKGNEVVVIGRVRRRFFKSAGSTQSRTEVVAETVVKAGQRGRVAAALARVRGRLDP